MANITRLLSGSYRARVHIGGGKYKSITVPTRREAQLLAAQMEADLTSNAKIPEEARITLGEAMQKYIDSKRHCQPDCVNVHIKFTNPSHVPKANQAYRE